MNMGKFGEVAHSSGDIHWECIWFQCAAAKLIHRPHIVNKPQKSLQTGGLVQAVLNTPNGISGVIMDAGLESWLSINIRTITPVEKKWQEHLRRQCVSPTEKPQFE